MSVKTQEMHMRKLADLVAQDLSYIHGEKESGPNGAKKVYLHIGKTFLRAMAKDLGLVESKVYDLRGGGTRLDRLNTLLGTRLGVIPPAGGNDLAVGGLEVEPKHAGFVLADLELGCNGSSPLFVSSNSGNATPRGRRVR